MRIFWQSFVDTTINEPYMRKLSTYLNGIAAPGTSVHVFGISPPDRAFGRLAELRCAITAIDNGIAAEEAGYDAYVMGHFQDPGLYELRSALSIPVIGTGEATLLWSLQLGRRLGLVTLDPVFEIMHHEQADRYGLVGRITHVKGLGLTPHDFAAAFDGDAAGKTHLLTTFAAIAQPMVDDGADVIIPAGVLPGLLVAGEHGLKVGNAPVVNCAAVALKAAEMWVQLRALNGVDANRGPGFALANAQAREDFRALLAKRARFEGVKG